MSRSNDAFFRELFGSRAARDGNIVRRKVKDVEFWIGREAFLNEVKRRGFRAYENAGQFIVFCNTEPLRRVA